MHSLFCITLWLPYITLCCIDSRFFLPLEQSHTVLLGCRLAASVLREAARGQLFYFIFNVNYKKKDLVRSGIFSHLTRTFYIQFSFSFKSRKASLRNLSLNQFTIAFQSFLLFIFFFNTTVLETIVRNALPENHFLE